MSKSDKSKDNSAKGLSRRDFLQTAGMATLAIGSGAMSLTPETAQAKQSSSLKSKPGGPVKPKRYNVLFIFHDQERYNPELMGKGHWPGRDRLIKMGTTFENHQVCSMVCTPSRATVFTGQHIQNNGMFDNTNYPWCDDLSFDIPTIGHMMRDAGYYSTYLGKWHLHDGVHEHFAPGEPLRMVGNEIMDQYGFSDYNMIGDAVGDTLHGYYTDKYVTATAQAWMRKTGKALNAKGQPWFMTLSLVNPHDVMFYDTDKPGQTVQGDPKPALPIAPEPDDRIYKKKWDVPLSPSRKEAWDKPGRPKAHYDYQQAMGVLTGVIPNEDERWQEFQDYYFNCISDVDRSLDTILTELDDLGLTDNTIVILTADHGELCGAHGMSGKGSTAFREQNNVPFMVYHPDMPGGRKCKAVTSHVDIIPTILAMTGADKHQKKEVVDKLHGHNVSPALEKPEKASYDAVREGALYCFGMWSFIDEGWLRDVAKLAFTKGKGITPVKELPKPPPGKRSSIRTVFDGRYKYSRYFNNQEHNRPTTIEEIFKLNDVELFDLENDPYEMNNLALDKKNQDLLLAMNDKLNRLIDREVGKDDGSHLPDIDGISWTAKPFDAKDYFKTW
jgi:arylsulfatase